MKELIGKTVIVNDDEFYIGELMAVTEIEGVIIKHSDPDNYSVINKVNSIREYEE